MLEVEFASQQSTVESLIVATDYKHSSGCGLFRWILSEGVTILSLWYLVPNSLNACSLF